MVRQEMRASAPEVSVVMAVYNGEPYLRESIESILSQTFTSFEFIVVDDGSIDATPTILAEYAQRDSRVVVLKNLQNLGLAGSLNKGLTVARGQYIARHDADDTSAPERLQKQVDYLNSNPSVALISTGIYITDSCGNYLGEHLPPLDSTLLRWQLLFKNPVRHPTVMWRKELIAANVGQYDLHFSYCEDYDLWVRIISRYQIETLPLCLVNMRQHQNSITATKADPQELQISQLTRRQLAHYYPKKELKEYSLTNLRALARRDLNLHEMFLSLDATRFKVASFQYLALFDRFLEVNALEKDDLGRQGLYVDVEQTLTGLLSRCKEKGWISVGISILLNYLYRHPYRWVALRSRFLKDKSDEFP